LLVGLIEECDKHPEKLHCFTLREIGHFQRYLKVELALNSVEVVVPGVPVIGLKSLEITFRSKSIGAAADQHSAILKLGKCASDPQY
jgi:hypothetical protein